MSDKEIIQKLKDEVMENYNSSHCEYTDERSCGNYSDCFEDGVDQGSSSVWYVVGKIIGMELEEPDFDDEY